MRGRHVASSAGKGHIAGRKGLAVACAVLLAVLHMKPRYLCALVLALALPALAQTQPQLEPLVPRKPAQPQLPPIEPLSRPARGSVLLRVLVLGALPDGVSSQVVEGLRAVLKLAPTVKDAVVLDAPKPCTKKACWIMAGAA